MRLEHDREALGMRRVDAGDHAAVALGLDRTRDVAALSVRDEMRRHNGDVVRLRRSNVGELSRGGRLCIEAVIEGGEADALNRHCPGHWYSSLGEAIDDRNS